MLGPAQAGDLQRLADAAGQEPNGPDALRLDGPDVAATQAPCELGLLPRPRRCCRSPPERRLGDMEPVARLHRRTPRRPARQYPSAAHVLSAGAGRNPAAGVMGLA